MEIRQAEDDLKGPDWRAAGPDKKRYQSAVRRAKAVVKSEEKRYQQYLDKARARIGKALDDLGDV